MTDKPTVTLGVDEWRSLIVTNLNAATTFVNGNSQITVEGLKAFDAHLARIRGFVMAWHAAAPPQEGAQAADAQAAPMATPEAQANGAAPKRRGGWPAGKPRKPKPEAAQVQ